MLNDDLTDIHVGGRRPPGNERVELVESEGDVYRCKGQLGRVDKEISLAPRLRDSNVGSDRLTAQYLKSDVCMR